MRIDRQAASVAVKTTKVLIVEDEVLFSELLYRTLSEELELIVVGVARDGETAVQLARELEPDVVLTDIELPGGMDGIEAATRIKCERPQTGIVILSMHNDRRFLTSMSPEKAYGWSYLLKKSVPDLATVVRTIQGSANGMVVLDPAVVQTLVPKRDSTVAKLSPRQLEVLELIAQGFNNAAIARQLTLTERSVETYIHAIYQELQISNENDVNGRVKATLFYLDESQLRKSQAN